MRAITSSSVDISPKSLVRCATATARTWPRIQPPFSRLFRRLPRALQSHTCRDAAAARSPVGLGANLSCRASFRLLATWRRPPSSARAQQGWALDFEPDAKGRFETDEDDARAGHFGIWKGCFAGPQDFRRWNKRSAKLLGALVHVAGVEFGRVIFSHRRPRAYGGHPAPRVPSARPTSPRLWPPAIRLALTTIHAPMSVVTSSSVDIARMSLWCVLNGDSESMAKNMPAVQSFAS